MIFRITVDGEMSYLGVTLDPEILEFKTYFCGFREFPKHVGILFFASVSPSIIKVKTKSLRINGFPDTIYF